MPAPKGNQFWKLRTKHGRDKLFANPDLLWKAACEYFEWVDENPLLEIDFKGKDLVRVEIPKLRPYTLSGLCLYLGCGTHYFNQLEATLRSHNDEASKEFAETIIRIRDVIYTQKLEGAAAGFLNASIIVRDLGLREQTDSKPVNATAQIVGMEIV